MSTTPTKSSRTADLITKAAVFSAHMQPKLTHLLIAANEVLQAARMAVIELRIKDIYATPAEEDN